MGIRTDVSLDEILRNAEPDGPDILKRLTEKILPLDKEVSITAELPAAIDPDIIITSISRWADLQEHLGDRKLRVYAYSYNRVVEKYVLGCVQQMQNVFVTVIPAR